MLQILVSMQAKKAYKWQKPTVWELPLHDTKEQFSNSKNIIQTKMLTLLELLNLHKAL